MYKGRKFIQAKIRAVGIYTRLVCGWGENYTSQYKYEACIKRKNDMERLYKKLMIIVIGLFFLLYFCRSIPRKQAGSLVLFAVLFAV